jgi:radical SAM protein with 4Fe4S-binding SPASM domain
MHELKAAGCRTVNLTGGEPLLREDWSLIARTASGLGLNVHLVTNGLLLDAHRLAAAVSSGVRGIAISLDGPKAVHDAMCRPLAEGAASRYDAAMEAIRRVAASPVKCGVITMVHKKNLSHLDEMYTVLAALDVDSWQVQIAMPIGRMAAVKDEYVLTPGDIGQLEARLAGLIALGEMPICVADNIGYYGRHEPTIRGSLDGTKTFWQGCIAGCRAVAITSDGGVKGCPSHPDSLTVGRIRDEGFSEIWNDADRFYYNTKWDDGKLTGGCAGCPLAKICRAGCTTMALASTGTIYDNAFCLKRQKTAKRDAP